MAFWLAVFSGLVAIGVHLAGQVAVGRAVGLRPRAILGGDRPRSWRRLAMLLGGVPANVVFTMVLASVVGLVFGRAKPVFVVDTVEPGMPAEGLLEPDDLILAIEGEEIVIGGGQSVADRIDELGERPIRFTVERRGRPLDVTLTPVPKSGVLRIGVELGVTSRMVPMAIGDALAEGAGYPFVTAIEILERLQVELVRDDSEAKGPVGITRVIVVTRRQPPWGSQLRAAAFMQVYLFMLLFVVDLLLFVAPRWRRRSAPAQRGADPGDLPRT